MWCRSMNGPTISNQENDSRKTRAISFGTPLVSTFPGNKQWLPTVRNDISKTGISVPPMVACLFIHGYLPPLLVRQRSNVPLQWPLSHCGYLADKSEQLYLLLLVAIKLLLAFLPCHIWYRSNRKLNLKNELVFLLDF